MVIFDSEQGAKVDVSEHYALLLGVNTPWEITNVDLQMANRRVDVVIEYLSEEGVCPECGVNSPRYDLRKSRTWRHLDTMQFTTYLHCETPRIKCKDHGVKSVSVPWSDKNSRFTLLFEAFAIRVLQSARSVEEASKLLGLNWHQAEAIKQRAVERGLARRTEEAMPYLGVDEKSFRKGHDYITSVVDLKSSRVLEVIEGRTENSCQTLLETALSESQRAKVEAVAMDMWPAFANAVNTTLENAVIVHDRFHISKHLNEAVDLVRRQENRQLLQEGDHRLKGSRYFWLVNEENLSEDFKEAFSQLKRSDLKVARAWAIKELFRDFWDYATRGWALRHFKTWYSWAIRSRLKPIKKVAKMLKRHRDNLLNYFDHPITNAASEGMNSRIQMVKSNARGFRSFKGYRASILFYCGGLDMTPATSH